MDSMDGNGNKVLAVKNWHVVLTLVLWLTMAVASYATANAKITELERRVENLEQQRVSKNEFDIAVQDIQRRLGRIEDKLDDRTPSHRP